MTVMTEGQKQKYYLVWINKSKFDICGVAHVAIAPEINWPQPCLYTKQNINGNVKMSPCRASMLNKNLAYRLLKMLINFYKFNISYLYYTSISWQHQNQHYAEDFASGLHETVLHVWLPVGPIKTGLYTWHFTILELCCTVKPLCKDSSLLHTVCLVLTCQVWL